MFLPRKGGRFQSFWNIDGMENLIQASQTRWETLQLMYHCLVLVFRCTYPFSTSLDFVSGIRFRLAVWNSPGTMEGPSKKACLQPCVLIKGIQKSKSPYLLRGKKDSNHFKVILLCGGPDSRVIKYLMFM